MPNSIFSTGTFDSRGMSVASPYSNSPPGTGGTNIPPYQQVTSIPDWLPRGSDAETELLAEYRDTNRRFDVEPIRRSFDSQRGRVLTSSMNAGNAAAASYASRARQAGGAGSLGADLIKAQLQVGAHKEAGQLNIDKEIEIANRQKDAATHAAGIAKELGSLRMGYISTLAQFAATQNATNARYAVDQRNAATNERDAATRERAEASESGARNRTAGGGISGWSVGTGVGRGSNQFTFPSWMDAHQYSMSNPYTSIYSGLGNFGGGG